MIKPIYKNALVFVGLGILFFSLLLTPNLVHATANPPINPPADSGPGNNNCGVDTSIIKCSETVDNTKTDTNGIVVLLKMALKFASGLVAALAVVGLIYAGFTYATAGDSQEKVKKSKEFMTNVVIGILLYMFMFAILNYLIPGGVFSQS